MKHAFVQPEDCTNMAEVRAGVDAVDQALVRLLARRFGYMDAAARIKPSRDVVRDEARKADVHAKVAAIASSLDLPVKRLAAIWEELMEQSIAYELSRWDTTRAQ